MRMAIENQRYPAFHSSQNIIMTHIEHLHTADIVCSDGVPMTKATRAVIMLHGRGGTAEDILSLAKFFQQSAIGAQHTAFLAPQATDSTWYPYSFLAPLASNEPGLSSGLGVIQTLSEAAARAGIAPENQYFLGFSQGACLMLEFALRHAQRYGGIYAFSGGMIGPDDGTSRNYAGNFAGTPVLMGCSDRDPHIPKERFLETASLLEQLGANVTAQLYPNMPHTIVQEEITVAQQLFEVNPLKA
jgi:predicted esterase